MAKAIDDAVATMVANLREKTGRTIDQWIRIARDSKLEKHGQIVGFLKSQHGLGHGYANLVTTRALQSGDAPAGDDELVEAQYAGAKAPLRPIYDKLLGAVGKFGGDVEVSPKKSYVSLRRSKQFGLIQPSTATRLDVGINLKGEKPTGRLENSGSFSAMVSHRVRVESIEQVDSELISWLKRAYAAA